MKIYLSGPISGVPNSHDAFAQAAAVLRQQGHTVVNPFQLSPTKDDMTWSDYLREDLTAMLTCDMIALLPGWEASSGAQLELHVAKKLGFHIRRFLEGKLV